MGITNLKDIYSNFRHLLDDKMYVMVESQRGPIIPGRFAVFAVFNCGFSVFHEYWCGFSVLQTLAVCGNGRIFDTVFGFILLLLRFLGF